MSRSTLHVKHRSSRRDEVDTRLSGGERGLTICGHVRFCIRVPFDFYAIVSGHDDFVDAAIYDICHTHREWSSTRTAVFRTGMNSAASTRRCCENGRLRKAVQVEAEDVHIHCTAARVLANQTDCGSIQRDACLVRDGDVTILRECKHRGETDRIRAGDRRTHQRVVVCVIEQTRRCG